MNYLTPQPQNKYYIAVVDGASDAQCGAFTESLIADNLGYWHWMRYAWIIADPMPSSTAVAWKLRIKQFMPTAYIFVTRFDPYQDWNIYGPGQDWLTTYLGGTPSL